MIRQAISCDICGTEKKQTNHWFIASEHAGELRICGWNVRNQRRGDTKHLCGQTCLHKLLDEFVAGSIGAKPAATAAGAEESPAVADRSLTSPAARSFAPVVMPDRRAETEPVSEARPLIVSPVAVVPLPIRQPDVGAPLVFGPRRSRAEAWERERERTQGHGDQGRPRKCF